MLKLMVFFATVLLSSSLHLECSYSLTQWVITGEIYTCVGTVVFSGDINSIAAVSQNHLPGKSNVHVEGFTINNQAIDFMPSNIQHFFENVRAIAMRNTTLKKLTKDDLKPFPRIEVIGFHYSRLEKIDGDLFSYNPRLQHINLSNNLFTNIGPNLLAPLASLHQINLSDSLCINENVAIILDITNLSRKLRFQCPPSVEMIERIILSGQKFVQEVDKQTADRINPAVLRIYENEKRIDELERLVKVLMEKFEIIL